MVTPSAVQKTDCNERVAEGSNPRGILVRRMYLVYSLATIVLFLVASPYFLYQAVRHGKYLGSLAERLGRLPVSLNLDREPSIWLHAVSVGETLTAKALAADLKERYPRHRLFISTTTMTGQQVARRSFQMADGIFYFPIDLTFVVRRVLGHRPAAAVHHDGDRDLAQPAAGVPGPWHPDHRDQRPHLDAVVSAIPARAAAVPPRARARRPLLRPGRGDGRAPGDAGRAARADHDHRQPEVRRAAGRPASARASSAARIACSATSTWRGSAPSSSRAAPCRASTRSS